MYSLLTKKQDNNMNEKSKKQEDTKKHILDKFTIGGVSGQSEHLVCPSCESSVIVSDKRHNVKMCGVCKHQWAK